MKKGEKRGYHHGNLAESLLNAVDEIATQFGLEAVTLRGCAKLVGVSPSSAFRHYVDKRALLTAFATRALDQLSQALEEEKGKTVNKGDGAFDAVCLAYVRFALQKPAFFRAMWREEAIYSNDQSYMAASNNLGAHLTGGFADTIEDADPANLSAKELLAWSSVHGLANLMIDGPIGSQRSIEENLSLAAEMIATMQPAVFDNSGI